MSVRMRVCVYYIAYINREIFFNKGIFLEISVFQDYTQNVSYLQIVWMSKENPILKNLIYRNHFYSYT